MLYARQLSALLLHLARNLLALFVDFVRLSAANHTLNKVELFEYLAAANKGVGIWLPHTPC